MCGWLRLPRRRWWGLTRYTDRTGSIDYISSRRSAPRDDSLSGGCQNQRSGNISRREKQWLDHLSSNASDNMKGLPEQTARSQRLVPNLRDQDGVFSAALHLEDKLPLILHSEHEKTVLENPKVKAACNSSGVWARKHTLKQQQTRHV